MNSSLGAAVSFRQARRASTRKNRVSDATLNCRRGSCQVSERTFSRQESFLRFPLNSIASCRRLVSERIHAAAPRDFRQRRDPQVEDSGLLRMSRVDFRARRFGHSARVRGAGRPSLYRWVLRAADRAPGLKWNFYGAKFAFVRLRVVRTSPSKHSPRGAAPELGFGVAP